MIKKILIVSVAVIVVGLSGFMWTHLKSADTLDLILCSVGKNEPYESSSLCYAYLINQRDVKADIEKLEKQYRGLETVLAQYRTADLGYKMEKQDEQINQRVISISDYYLSHGLNINAVDNYGMTVLHSEVLANNVKLVEYLIRKGAKLNIKAHNSNFQSDLTPLELVDYLIQQNPKTDRSAVRQLLVVAGTGKG